MKTPCTRKLPPSSACHLLSLILLRYQPSAYARRRVNVCNTPQDPPAPQPMQHHPRMIYYKLSSHLCCIQRTVSHHQQSRSCICAAATACMQQPLPTHTRAEADVRTAEPPRKVVRRHAVQAPCAAASCTAGAASAAAAGLALQAGSLPRQLHIICCCQVVPALAAVAGRGWCAPTVTLLSRRRHLSVPAVRPDRARCIPTGI